MKFPSKNDFIRYLSVACAIFAVIAIFFFMVNILAIAFILMVVAVALFFVTFAIRALLGKPKRGTTIRTYYKRIK